jgi:hypothetical protein
LWLRLFIDILFPVRWLPRYESSINFFKVKVLCHYHIRNSPTIDKQRIKNHAFVKYECLLQFVHNFPVLCFQEWSPTCITQMEEAKNTYLCNQTANSYSKTNCSLQTIESHSPIEIASCHRRYESHMDLAVATTGICITWPVHVKVKGRLCIF